MQLSRFALLACAPAVLGLLLAPPAGAQAQAPAAAAPAVAAAAPPTASTSLKDAFDAAWQQQPEARALAQRRVAAQATQRAADTWTPAPMALELAHTSDRLNSNEGQREWEAGIAIALWRPGERSSSRALAEAQAQALERRADLARLQLAGRLREAWWPLAQARLNHQLADQQLQLAEQLAADVERRMQAGELARSDLLQAQGSVAAARATQAEAAQAQVEAAQRWQAVAGQPAAADAALQPEAEPAAEAAAAFDSHPRGAELAQRLAVAQASAALTQRQGAGNPEITLGTTRERGSFGERGRYALNIGLRLPFGQSARQEAQWASAQAEALELEAQLEQARLGLATEQHSLKARVAAMRVRLAAARQRAHLAEQTRELIDRSFRLGESDLPTRLRTHHEAVEAARQQAAARLELASAISQWRQSLGLLP
ncbi:TolC family protein [Xenophilus arseniciresistens]|uniref:TolC family protein n=1 Tax=Xenophilus arseniciresistens TaxID=1283306 RepID=A0AAE3N7W7_9BURK|nr:TolC family protein [Xenophilus arseniciresistens]MDA7414899.1 TolC family protein [Xenophilus arseniciresistens]